MAHVITTTIHTNVYVIQDLLGHIVNTLIVQKIGVRMAQGVSMETQAIPVYVLMVSLEIIVKHVIIVIIKTAVRMVNVRMGILLILAIVNRNTKEQTVN